MIATTCVMTRSTQVTRPDLPATVARQDRESERPTLPPEPGEREAVLAFERAIAACGEAQARLQNLTRTRP